MSRIRKAQEETRQKKLRDTPHGRDIELGKTTAAQYNAAYGTVNTPQGGGGHRGKIRREKAQGVNKLMSTQSASVVPDDETASKIKAKRKTGIIKKTATTQKKTGKLGSKIMKNPKKFEAEYQASGTGKAGDTFEAMKTPKKKRKKHTKRAARERFREAQKNKKPKTKKTKKTKNQKDLEAAYGSPKDTERMMEGKPLKESLISKISKKFKKGK
jgi:hypothetical protein